MSTDKAAGPIGASVLRAEDPRLLTGRGRFVGDVVLPRMLEAVFVRSGHAHARLLGVDSEAARGAPGVEAVLDARDLPPVTFTSNRHPHLLLTPQPVLATDRVRFVGEPLAIVLAENRYVAEDAAELVDVEYDELAPSLSADRQGDPLFDDIPDNVVFRDRQVYGDVDEAFARAATVVTKTLRFPRQSASPLEPRGCVADFDPSSRRLTVWSSTQAPHRLARDLAAVVGLPEHAIRVVMHDIGGGFGQKIPTQLEDVAVVLASMACGRPVRWMEDRQENLIAAPHSRDQDLHLELALDEQMRFTGLRARIVGNAGAYSFNSASPLTEAYRAARSVPGVYRIDNFAYDITIALSNKSPIAPYRGVGMVAAQCARELLIDEAARQLGVDRFELRARNMIRGSEMPYTTATGWVFQDMSFQETLAQARERLEEPAAAAAAPRRSGRLRGVGISPYAEPTGMGGSGGMQLHGFLSPSHDSARVVVNTSGKATVSIGTPSMGQGLETTMAQVAAEALGLPVTDVSVTWSDTSQAPISLTGSRASRGAVVSGGAVGLAAGDVKKQLLEVAAQLLEADAEDLDIRDGGIWVAGEPEARLSVRETVAAGFGRDDLRSPEQERSFEATRLYDPPANYSNACVVAVVDVDPDTGGVEIQRLLAVEDCGTMINPMIVEGQFLGAAAQAIGAALLERIAYNEDGQPITSTLVDYLLPTAGDTVRVELSHIETPSTATWGGLKGVGESGAIGSLAAIVAAVADAVAARGGVVEDLPLLPGTVWSLLQGADGRPGAAAPPTAPASDAVDDLPA
ncbi:xanthine dehydrogenase family protein molybdopterin-binding subunit [Blastococcus sp. CT_GayMR20]|uniref:xanthine dehydrogenase family protein molybdopterin-binding subunit n=1 Tax=Blastococcus sp. CT_GayMR20 TaxID=2559609 RepID=UPI00107460BA|nr:xanthine dehydrogenase family protein molybdopterin-binding subunit [Blastococcus sp. CT_GayMR20]TFV83110.1 xanthine dehydrogenase family protein molybdopterin-binding subunit [Blastococcus sp. CT_GayMR20]